MPDRPHIVGYQCAGRIRTVGPDVADRAVGQRVVATMLWGSHAELVAVPAVLTWVIPDGADVVDAACVPVPFATADDCLFEFGHLAAGETVLVQAGASGVGLACLSWPSGPGRPCSRRRRATRSWRACASSASTMASTTGPRTSSPAPAT